MSRFTNVPGLTPFTDEEARQQLGLSRRIEAEQQPLQSMLAGTTRGLSGTVQSSMGNVTGALGLKGTSQARYDSGLVNARAAQDLTPAAANWENVNDLGSFGQFVGLNAATMPITTAPGIAGALLTRGTSPALGAFAGSAMQT